MRDGPRRVCDPGIEAELDSPTWSDHQHETYGRLRASAPICWSPAGGEWLVSTFELVDIVLGHPAVFSNVGEEAAHIAGQPDEIRELVPTLTDHFGGVQLNISDPPDHVRLRRAFNRPFMPRRIDEFEPWVSSTAEALVTSAVTRDGRLDLVASVAGPLPVRVIAEFIGIQPGLLDAITTVTLGQRYFFGSPAASAHVAGAFEASVAEWRSVLRSEIEVRRHGPRADVLTSVAGLVDEGQVSMEEAIATCLHLVIAGNSTTTALIGNTLFLLLRDRRQLEMVVDRPELTANAVEEALRFEPPLPTVRRVARANVTVGGQHIGAGDQVCCVLAAAGRDPDHFARPDEFDVTRPIALRQQIAFGRGIHICIGAPLARLEAAIAVRTVFRLLPGIGIEPGHRPEWHEVRTHRSLTNLMVVDNDRSAPVS